MNNLGWLIRAARWVRNPPSAGQVKLVVGLILLALAIVTLEWLELWPTWATLEHGRGGGFPRP